MSLAGLAPFFNGRSWLFLSKLLDSKQISFTLKKGEKSFLKAAVQTSRDGSGVSGRQASHEEVKIYERRI